ncbi:protein FAR1-RELATED SEQUENCE 5-like [Salvia miltiorrhiza]|uniref:protein FAR1-RELATED SEQUENCE 5-like n=1 Tax=Salvia miltiorrhiza TaxID=226208 RepID=UPI0025ABFB74|nr:protein FAR1-RELATED SEQUENCE 5-like [Salvia miltiorrhiza]
MDSGCTSSRRLDFEDVNGRHDDHVSDMVEDGNENQLDNITSSRIEEDKPKIGMCFDTEEDAYGFYLNYSKHVGFSIRRSRSHKDKSGSLIDRVFCCSAEGKRTNDKRDIYVSNARPETRFGCQAKLKVSSRVNGKFCVVQFVEDHNHYLSSPHKTHLHRSHRKITSSAAMQIQMANDVGITPKASHDLMVRQVGGRENLGFIPQDYKNYLRSKRTRETRIGDTGGVLEYLQKMQFSDPNFFYAIQVDEDDLITNIFWSDAKMRTDYSNFGDVICFDTTYKKNNEGRPIALFVGVNHHKQTVIFGAALLYDETSSTFEWLFDTFTRAMREKKPKTILTDQDAAMAKALTYIWPETHHRLCLWHIFQNAAIHLSGIFSKFKDFSKDFGACVYDFEEEDEFIAAWDEMLKKYSLEDNDWLRRMFNLKEKWALVYGRQTFCADMTTTQRSESMNSVVKRYVNYKHKFLDFFNHFERLLEDRRYEEVKADFRANTSLPCLSYPVEILKHAVSIYTPEVYKIFEQEWYKSHDSSLECFENGELLAKYRITPHRKSHHHIVTIDLSSEKINCSCRKFEFAGILCSHSLKVFGMHNIKKIPNEYILKRWTRKAKIGFSGDANINVSEMDPKLLQNIRYKELCGLYVQLVTKASENEDTYRIVKDGILKMFDMVDGDGELEQRTNCRNLSLNADELQITLGAKGIKSKNKTTSSKRLKSGLEKSKGKRKASRKKGQPLTNSTTSPPLLSTNLEGVEENLTTISSVSDIPYQRFNTIEEFGTSSNQQNFGGMPFSMNMTNLLLAQQPLNFDYLGANNLQERNSLNKEAYLGDVNQGERYESPASDHRVSHSTLEELNPENVSHLR